MSTFQCLVVGLALCLVFLNVQAKSKKHRKCEKQHVKCWSSESNFPQRFPNETCYSYDGHPLCTCSSTTADCSRNNGSLQYVPVVFYPNGTVRDVYQVLNFSFNNITSIDDNDFFANASTAVQVIDLYFNGLVHIADGVFDRLQNLTMLLLGGTNFLGYPGLVSVLHSIPRLLKISMSCVGLDAVPKNTFRNLTSSSLDYLDLSWNNLGLDTTLNLSEFTGLSNLTELILWQNKIYDFESAYFDSLETLNLAGNRLYDFPDTCVNGKGSNSLFPHLKVLQLSSNVINCIGPDVCLPKLESLDLSYNNFEYFTTDTFSGHHRFPSLLSLDIMQMGNKIFRMESHFINNSRVIYVKFLFNQVDFADSTIVHPEAFHGCPNLEMLILGGNKFKDVSDEQFYHMFHKTKKSLNFLDLSNTQLTSVPDLSRFARLQTVKLYGNRITAIPDGAFDQLTRLGNLGLDDNYISTITENTFGPNLRAALTRKYDNRLTVGGNPFVCDCELLWFRQWMRDAYFLFKDYHSPSGASTYNCTNRHNESVNLFVLNQQACLLGDEAESFVIATCTILIVFFFVFLVYFPFRWHMRLWLYVMCRSRHYRRRRHGCKYDVFVSYAEENVEWIVQELMPKLEGEWGLKLCVHYRDFIPGKHIVDNISDCVEESQRVLLVFSPHFARSQWCQFELRLCQTCVMERDDVMVLVTLQETETRDMSGAMLAVLRTTTYIEWFESQDARDAFWPRLRMALEDSYDVGGV